MNDWFVTRLGCLALSAAIAMLSASCDSGSPPPMRVGTIPWLGYEPLALADNLGYLNSVPHRFLEYSSSTQVLRAFRNNTIEVAALTLDETLELAEDVPDIRVVLVLDTSLGADVVLGQPGITNLAGLRGRRVAYESTALGAYLLGRALETAGLNTEDVTLVASQLDDHEKIFTNGQVDAVATFEPVRSRLLATGAKVLFSSAQIPGEIMDVLVVRQAFLEKNPNAVKTLLRGVLKAQVYQKISTAEANRLSSARLELTDEQVRNSFQLITLPNLAENQRLLIGNSPALLESAKRLSAVMLKLKLLHHPPTLEQLIDGSALEQLNSGN